MLVLIVEDSKISQRSIEAKVKSWGYDAICAGSGEEAWEILLKHEVRLVITDWMLPGMDGPSLCKKIRASDQQNYVYIIMITALEGLGSMVIGMEAGADDFIRKPIIFEELLARIRAGERVLNLEQKLQLQNQHLLRLTAELEKAHSQLHGELVLAGEMQKKLLPESASLIQDVYFESIYLPSLHVSGDLLNFFALDHHHIGFYTIDVAGHGVSAAMMAYTLNRVLNPELNKNCPLKHHKLSPPFYELVSPPSLAVLELNDKFQNDNEDSLYFTMLYGIIDTNARKFSFCQAGHPSPIYIKANSPPQTLGDGGFPVGLLPNAVYDNITLAYESGDRLFMFSDGITECENADGELFGTQRLQAFFTETQDLDLPELLQQLQTQICVWNGGDQFEDDISVLAIKFP